MNIRAFVLKAWPTVVALLGAIYFAANGHYAEALACLGIGGSASLSGDALHRMPPPVDKPIPPPAPPVKPPDKV